MKRHLCQICLLAFTTLTAPAAFSGSDILQCVDASGRVTLTDRPCDAASSANLVPLLALDPLATNDGGGRVAPAPLVAAPAALPPARALQRNRLARERVAARALSSDVATLKAARAQFVLGDVRATPVLAGLD